MLHFNMHRHNIVLWWPAAKLQMQNLNTHLKLPSAVSTFVINFPAWLRSQTTSNAALVTFKTPFKAIVISTHSVQISKCSWLTLLIIVAGQPVINIWGDKCTFFFRMSASVLNGLASMSAFLQSAPDACTSYDPNTPIKRHISYSWASTLRLHVAIKRSDLNKGAIAGPCSLPGWK